MTVPRIELGREAYETPVLPLNYTAMSGISPLLAAMECHGGDRTRIPSGGSDPPAA